MKKYTYFVVCNLAGGGVFTTDAYSDREVDSIELIREWEKLIRQRYNLPSAIVVDWKLLKVNW